MAHTPEHTGARAWLPGMPQARFGRAAKAGPARAVARGPSPRPRQRVAPDPQRRPRPVRRGDHLQPEGVVALQLRPRVEDLRGSASEGGRLPGMRQAGEIGRRVRVRPGQTLAELRPDLAAELHPTRNGDFNPYAVARWSVLPVWWRCASCGHEWEVSPRNRTGCPWCAAHRVARERSLAVLRPDLAAELHPTRNGDLDPHAIGTSSSLKLWWRCRGCGREWRASVRARSTGGGGCRSCLRRRGPPATIPGRPAARSRRPAAPHPQRRPRPLRRRPSLSARRLVALPRLRPGVASLDTGPCPGAGPLPRMPPAGRGRRTGASR